MSLFLIAVLFAIAHIVLPMWLGDGVLRFFIRRTLPRALHLSIALGLGWSLYATTFSAIIFLRGSSQAAFLITDFLLSALAFALNRIVSARKTDHAVVAPTCAPEICKNTSSTQPALNSSWVKFTWCMSVVMITLAMSYAFFNLMINPHGEGDASAIWNLHARFLFRGGEYWQDGFTETLSWNHPDYPWLVPGLVVRGWHWAGQETTLVPILISNIFFAVTIVLFWSALNFLRSSFTANLGTCVFLSASTWTGLARHQTGDLPLSFFYLLSAVILCLWLCDLLSDYLRSAMWLVPLGIALGGAAWTKNEGKLFALFVFIAVVWQSLRHVQRKSSSISHTLALSVGFLPTAFAIILMKLNVEVGTDLITQPRELLDKLFSFERAWITTRSFGMRVLDSGQLLLLYYVIIVGLTSESVARRLGKIGLTLVAATLGGYFTVYMITPYPLQDHINTSLDRLLLQLWPSFLFALFLVIKSPQEALAKPQNEGAATAIGTDSSSRV